ncbi:TonB family protein [Massilia glaciei]|uniref:TonB family protein n=1 Tax=Massilia glaciei TaxID=1524097 RepID=UPI001E4A6D51|nr:TonB family protein [Massilia glaciei]
MNLSNENRPLIIAVSVSVLAHALLLAVRFVAPEAFTLKPNDLGLEVILVNAKHDKAPIKADALAQANLDGGGNADAGRAASPLPNMARSEDGDSIKAAQRRIAEMAQVQDNLLTRLKDSKFQKAPVTEREQPDSPQLGDDMIESSKVLARREAEIAQRISDENKRPRKTYITPSTKAVGYAIYYKNMQKRVEEIGTLNFPKKNGRQMYGELILTITIFQDGTLYEKDDGLRIEQSSGNPALDKAAMAIVRRSAPFGQFPRNMRSTDRDDLWVIVTRFNFTRDQTLEANLSEKTL